MFSRRTDSGSLAFAANISDAAPQDMEKLAAAVGQELVVGVGAKLSQDRSIAELVRKGHAVVRRAS